MAIIKKSIFLTLLLLINSYLFANNITVNSSKGIFKFDIPETWEDISVYDNTLIDYYQFRINEACFFNCVTIDNYALVSAQYSNILRSQLNYSKYPKTLMNNCHELFCQNYIAGIQENHPDLKLLEKKITFLANLPANYLKFTYNYKTEIIYQEVYEVLYNGYSCKFTYFYDENSKYSVLKQVKQVLDSIQF